MTQASKAMDRWMWVQVRRDQTTWVQRKEKNITFFKKNSVSNLRWASYSWWSEVYDELWKFKWERTKKASKRTTASFQLVSSSETSVVWGQATKKKKKDQTRSLLQTIQPSCLIPRQIQRSRGAKLTHRSSLSSRFYDIRPLRGSWVAWVVHDSHLIIPDWIDWDQSLNWVWVQAACRSQYWDFIRTWNLSSSSHSPLSSRPSVV